MSRILDWIERHLRRITLADAGLTGWALAARRVGRMLGGLSFVLLVTVCFVALRFNLEKNALKPPIPLEAHRQDLQVMPMVVGVAIVAALLFLALEVIRRPTDRSGLGVGVFLATIILLVALLPEVADTFPRDAAADDVWVHARVDLWRGILIGGIVLVLAAWATRWPELSIGAMAGILAGSAVLSVAPFANPAEAPEPDAVPTPRQSVALSDVHLLDGRCPTAGQVVVIVVTPKLDDDGKAVGTDEHRHLAVFAEADRCETSRRDSTVADVTAAFARGKDDETLTDLLGQLSTTDAIVYLAKATE